MHIAYVCADPGVPVFGQKGCSVHVQEVLRALLRRGERVTLLCARRGGAPPPDLAAVAIRPLPRLPAQQDPGFEVAVQNLAAATAQALLELDAVDLIYERHALWSHRAMELGVECAIPTCLEVNAPLIAEQQRYRDLPHPQLAHSGVQRAYSAAATILAVSTQVAASIRQDCPRAQRVLVVHNGVDALRFQAARPVVAGTGRPGLTIGFCGSLRPWHGVVDLIEAFALHHRRHPASRLIVIGDGPEREPVLAAIRRCRLSEQVQMSGPVPPAAIPDWLARLDVGVAPYPNLPELYFSPLKLFEYLAAGLCAVAPRLGDPPSLLQHEDTGILYEPGDRQALAAVFDRLSDEPHLFRRIGARGRELALARYSWDQVVGRILAHGIEPGARSCHEA